MEFRALAWLALPAMLMAQPDVLVRGVVHPLAQPRFDGGAVDAGFRLGYMRMMFGQTAAQRMGLQRLLAAQRDPASPEYRQWLTPEQYADRFGLSAADLAAVTAWLTSAGFRIEYTARGRDWIAFSGTAAQVAAAFHTSIHRYQVRGETHFANSSEPSLPGDLAPLVSTIFGLNDFYPHSIAKPAYTSSAGQTLAPGDLATIYDINRLYQQSIDGTGQSIVIVGQSEVDLSDVQQFRTAYGLGAQNIQVVATGTNPGFTPDLLEADLDLEWAGAIARGATLIYVYSTSADASVFYAIDQDLAPVISESFGVCEAEQPASAASEYEAEAQKGNALGITWLAASGDAGAATCDLGESSASYGLAVSFPASVPEVTAVGGTQFNEGSTNYWSATNGANGGSALSYIPEIAWNDTAYGGGLAATGGGVSTLFPKPSWQSGAGVPEDGQRDVPDIAMAASNDHDPFSIVTSGQAQLVGGTSAAAPVMAGIIALLNQQLATNGVGNLNASLYGLAASSSQMFHDIVSGNNIVPCVSGSPDCVNGTLGYYAGPGYDLTTGLGSVDAYNFVTGWRGGTSGVMITSLSPGAINAGASTFTLTVNGLGFASGAAIEWNGAAQPTTLVSSTALTTVVSASLIASPATVAITVVSGGKTSGTLYFTVNPATATGVSYSDQRVTTQAPAASGCVLPTAVTSFVTTQNTVYLYFSAVVSSSDSLSSDWLAPDGTTVSGGNWSQLSGDNCFTGASLSIANLPATQLGEWTARVYDNRALLFSVPFTVSAPGTAVPVITAVDNAASYTSGVASPGEIVVILGTGLGPAQLAGLALDSSGLVSTQNSGTSVQFSGYPAPLVYTSATAIAAIVPYEVSGSTAQVTVTYQGKTSAAFSVNLAPSVPGIFTSDASGLGQAAAYNYQTGTFNSTTQPAAQGSTIILYATGEGQTSPGGIDGKPAAAPLPMPLLPVSVTIGGVAATVQYVGGAYGEVAGVLQLNVTVPTTVFGSAVPVVVQVGSAVTQTGVTIAVAESGGSGFAITSDEISGLLYATSSGELSCSTPPAQTSFLTTDPAVYLYFTFSGAQTGDVLSYNWVHPSGAIDAAQPMQTIPFSGAGCTSESLPISGGAPAKEPGNWQVRVYHNGAFQFALTFTVINPAPSFTVSSQETAASVVTGANGNLTCTVPAAQSNFLSTSGGVWTYFAMQGAQLGDVIAFNWVHPSGQVDPYQPSFTLNFSGSGCAATAFPIAGTQAAAEAGAWQAQAFRNGTLLFSLPFTIAAPGFTVTSSEMTAALPTNANGSLNCAGTPAPQNVFPLTIADAYAWFTFSGGTTGDIISANWVNPSGGIDPDQPSLTLSFSGAGCIAMALPIQGYTTLTGAWQVKVFHNGLPLFALPFTIQP